MTVELTISVVIPTCRRPDLLARCLDRLAPGAQTLSSDAYEVIVTDDGEPTVEQLVSERYPWAIWSQGPRRGPAANRNAGARQARGEWLAFTDDDCIPDPAWLAAFVNAIHDGCRVYEGKTTCAAGIHSPLDHAPANSSGGYLWSCNMFIRRAEFRELGGFDEEFLYPHLEDVDLRERLIRAGQRFEFVPAAMLDHPPRRLPGGWRLALTHESEVYYWYKSGRRTFAAPQLLGTLVRARLRTLLRHRLRSDTFWAMASLAIEVAGLLPRLPFWEWKYRRRFSMLPYRP